MPTLLDHLLAALLLIVWPVVMARTGPVRPEERLKDYKLTIAVQWAHMLLLFGLWIWGARSWTDLGFGLEVDWELGVAAALALGAIGVAVYQRHRVRTDPKVAAAILRQVERIEGLVPETAQELRWFRALVFTAGVCEETIYRGFLILYLSTWMPTWAALVVAGLGFGAAHLYQGVRPALTIVVVGVIMGALYLLAGSLWVPIALHAWGDLIQGQSLRAALDSARGERTAASSGPELAT